MNDRPADRSTDAELVRLVDSLRVEADTLKRQFVDQWDQNLRRYVGDHWDTQPPQGLSHFTLNRTQNAIIASVAVQTEQPPRIRIEPRPRRQPPVYHLDPAAAGRLSAAMAAGLEVPALTPPQATGLAAMSQAARDRLLALTLPGEPGAAGGEPSGTSGGGGLFTEDDFHEVSDAVRAKLLERLVSAQWVEAESDYHLIENILNNAVVGHQPMLIEWDDQRHVYKLTNVHPRNIWIDPTARDVTDAEYLIYDQVLSARAAKAKFPELSQAIEQVATTGTIADLSARPGDQLGAPYRDTLFERDMVILRTCWRRHQPYPMDPADAEAQGLVRRIAMAEADDQAVVEAEGWVLASTGEPTAPGEANWPVRHGVQQIQTLADRLVQNIECPYRDIPFCWNVNIPIPFKPYGQGEPERLEDLSQAINRIASILHNHLKYYQSPQENRPESVHKALKGAGNSHSHPGKVRVVSDWLFERFGGKLSFLEMPAQLPNGYVELLGMLLEEHDRLSGHIDVLQGRAKSGFSGELVKALQSAARGPLGFKSLHTERLIHRLVQLTLRAAIDFLPETKWQEVADDLPLAVLRELITGMADMAYHITVEIVSGKGVNRQINRQETLDLHDRGLLSTRTTLQRLDVADPEQETKRLIDELAAKQTAAMAAASPPPAPAGA